MDSQPVNPIILSTKKLTPDQKALISNEVTTVIDRDYIRLKPVSQEEERLINFVRNLDAKFQLIVTSKQAIPAISQMNLERCDKILVVGQKVFNAMTQFVEASRIRVFDQAENLITNLDQNTNHIIYPCSSRRLKTIPNYADQLGSKIEEFHVYHTQLIPFRIDQAIDYMLFFSPSGVESYYKSNMARGERAIAIGPTTALALEAQGIETIISTKRSVDGVIETLNEQIRHNIHDQKQ